MKNIVLYAPPAAGKGTQCELLKEKYGYEILSIGQVLRNARSTETEIGRKIIETQDKGILTPDDIVLEALKKELEKLNNKDIIIEGYPRNIDQAMELDKIFNDYIVINLNLPREVAMKRTLGRINCSKCNKIYNIYFDNMMPKVEGICDECGEELKSRSDDNETSFNTRFDVYEENAPRILEYYDAKQILHKVDCSKTVEEIFSNIVEIIEN